MSMFFFLRGAERKQKAAQAINKASAEKMQALLQGLLRITQRFCTVVTFASTRLLKIAAQRHDKGKTSESRRFPTWKKRVPSAESD
ncbi:MAG TPA: hypothetical protein H9961_06785 [Candidatus Duodenibacillus intestinavium]|nr:hypothetical protein [Candidatus Duodenibacillus intestinavium]